MRAYNVMTEDVIAVRADTTVREIVRLRTENHIGGAPVVNDGSEVIGMVNEGDLFLPQKKFLTSGNTRRRCSTSSLIQRTLPKIRKRAI